MSFNEFLSKVNDVMYTYILIILLVGVGIYFTVRTRGAQFRLLKDGLKSMLERGGPSYYMEKALGKRWLGVLFSVLLIICFASGYVCPDFERSV